MEYIALFSGFGTAHTSKDKNLSRVIWDEINRPVNCSQDVKKSFQVSPIIIYRCIKGGKSHVPIHLGTNMVRWKASDIEVWITDRESTNLKGDPNAQS